MPNFILLVACNAIGAWLASRGKGKDPVIFGLGVACGVTMAFAIGNQELWALLLLLLTVPWIVRRRHQLPPLSN